MKNRTRNAIKWSRDKEGDAAERYAPPLSLRENMERSKYEGEQRGEIRV